jgi:2-oxoisovalerate dehydrogenase E1 component
VAAPAAVVAPVSGTPDQATVPRMPGEALMMPFGDLTVSEGRLIRWVKQVGDAVSAGELVVEVETDKAVVEVEAPCSGIMAQHLEVEGTMVKMGQQIAVITPSEA